MEINSTSISKLQSLVSNPQIFKKYIRYIRFPYYKNLTENTKIDFEFPLTVFVGPNGCGKSSVLQAIYGCPKDYSLGKLWFSTSLDPIEESQKRNCLIYSYFNQTASDYVEVIKQRIKFEKARKIPDYWEPSRPIKEYGMEFPPEIPEGQPIPEGRSKTRWNVLEKHVEFIDFRGELSSFDKYFYFGKEPGKKTLKSKQDYIRCYSSLLKRAFKGNNEVKFRKNFRHKPVRELNSHELEIISEILGRQYKASKIIEHSFYDGWGKSAVFMTDYNEYSEAHAGSGEMAIVSLVLRVLDAPQYSLILLDEPETSLHPGAQNRLIGFLADQILKNKHQIILCSHSPVLLKDLPEESIKVFHQENDGRFSVRPKSIPEEAFFYLGYKNPSKKRIIVEDIAAKKLVDSILRNMGESTMSAFETIYFPGGVSEMKRNISVYSRLEHSNIYIFFDGDQKPQIDIPNPDKIPPADHPKLNTIIEEITGQKIDFYPDGHEGTANDKQLIKLQLSYISFFYNNVFFLPEKPEAIMLCCSKETDISTRLNIENKQTILDISAHLFGGHSKDNVNGTYDYLIKRIDFSSQLIQDIINKINVIRNYHNSC